MHALSSNNKVDFLINGDKKGQIQAVNSTPREYISSTHSQLKGEFKQKHRLEAISFPELTFQWGLLNGEEVGKKLCKLDMQNKQRENSAHPASC